MLTSLADLTVLFGSSLLMTVICCRIQDIDKKLCIICPKHKYKITLAEGEGLFRAPVPNQEVRTFKWYSKGIKQRVHKVSEDGGDVFVTLSDTTCFIESDYYYTEQGRKVRNKVDDNRGIDSGEDEDDS